MSNDGTMIGSNQNITVRPFGLRDKFGYLCGDLGTCFILGLVNSFLMIYYTNVLGISGVIVGSLYFVTKLFDAFVDVGVGRLCDTSKLTIHGRFNPWVRRMKYPFCIIAVVLFLPFVNDFSYTAKIIYICCSYFIYGSLLSTVSIPYGAMSAAISSNPEDRVSLSTWRSVGSAIGGGTTGFFYSDPDVYHPCGWKPGNFRAAFLLDCHWMFSAGLYLFNADLSVNDGTCAR
jgi:Na+/melibiose symporter and related transporters